MSGQTLTMLAHGDAGSGKSWFAGGGPAPRLILDAEGRAKYLPGGKKILWDPWNHAPPEAGDWETCIAIVPDFRTFVRVREWLESGQHCFVSLSVDSLMEIQKRLKDSLGRAEEFGDPRQFWGEVLDQLEREVRLCRDLVLIESNSIECVVFTVGSAVNEKTGRAEPLLQGALRKQMPYFVDIVGYMYADFDPQSNAITRSMLISPTSRAVAKDGTDRLVSQFGPVIRSPHLPTLYAALNGTSPETGTVQPEHDREEQHQ